LKYDDFRQITRSRSALSPLRTLAQFTQISHELLAPLLPPVQGVRLLGVAVSGLEGAGSGSVGQQLGLGL
ncbi:MAG: DNA polymerase IV, partial [Cytophagaceae bacterium]